MLISFVRCIITTFVARWQSPSLPIHSFIIYIKQSLGIKIQVNFSYYSTVLNQDVLHKIIKGPDVNMHQSNMALFSCYLISSTNEQEKNDSSCKERVLQHLIYSHHYIQLSNKNTIYKKENLKNAGLKQCNLSKQIKNTTSTLVLQRKYVKQKRALKLYDLLCSDMLQCSLAVYKCLQELQMDTLDKFHSKLQHQIYFSNVKKIYGDVGLHK